MSLEQKELSFIFSSDPSTAEKLIEDLLNNKDPKFIIYFINYLGRENIDPQKATYFFEKYYQSFKPLNTELLFFYINFLLDQSIKNLNQEILETYIQNEEDLDKIYSIVKKLINLVNEPITVINTLKSFYLKIKNFEYKEIYLKRIVNDLKSLQKIPELEEFLTLIHQDLKNYWIVENLIEVYSIREEYEKMLNVFIGVITTEEFLRVWSESLGIIDKTIEKIVEKEGIIFKIISHLQNINILADKFSNNIYKIYLKIIENLENMNEEQSKTFFHALYNFLSLVFSKNLVQEDKLIQIIHKILVFQKSSEILEKILEISKEKSLQIINKIINKIANKKEYLNYLTTFVLSNFDILQLETLKAYLENISLDQWIKIINNNFTIKQELISEASTQTKNNLITAFIISKKF
ncbi:MAG: hypothetical protein ACK4ZM_02900, partial [bacterium]